MRLKFIGHLGLGLLESTYESALSVEFEINGIQFQRQVICSGSLTKPESSVIIAWICFVENSVIVEIKSVERHDPIFEAQLLTYLKITGHKRGFAV